MEKAKSRKLERQPTALGTKALKIPTWTRPLEGPPAKFSPVAEAYPMGATAYYLSLIREENDPIWRQVIPDERENKDCSRSMDPLDEIKQSPVPNLIHRYPDRAVLLAASKCAVNCRFCMRKRRIRNDFTNGAADIEKALDHIAKTPTIAEVILSGGDPLTLSNQRIGKILKALKKIPHMRRVRIHTRMPCVSPRRITPGLAEVLKNFYPLFINIHFNHPRELTEKARSACVRLAEAGAVLGSQTVLLKGINDSPGILKRLMTGLLDFGVRPYYLHHPDPIAGTGHFQVSVPKGLAIIKALQGKISGMAMPFYMLDLPGGGGKIPLGPERIRSWGDGKMTVENYEQKRFTYPIDI